MCIRDRYYAVSGICHNCWCPCRHGQHCRCGVSHLSVSYTHLPHGVSNAIMLAPVMKFNEPVVREKFAAAYDRVNHNGDASLSVEEKSAWVLDRMCSIIKHLDIPTSLKEYGVSKDDLDFLVTAGMDVQRLLVNNMRKVTAEDARALYLEIL